VRLSYLSVYVAVFGALLAWLGAASDPGKARAHDGKQLTGLAGAESAAFRTEQLTRYAEQLGHADGEVRARAAEVLSSLGVESLPAVQARLGARLSTRPSAEEAARVLTAFRHAAGSRRADDEVDLRGGVLPVLARERSAAVLAMAEPLLLLRSIEAMEDGRAHTLIASFVSLDAGSWDNELRLLRKRMGLAFLPTLIALRSHEEAVVRRFAQAGVAALGMEDPTVALALPEPHLRAELVRAYGNPPEYAAMPLIVRMVGSESLQVRAAARETVDRFGKNAIWQVRELYEELTGQAANKSWSFERSARELYTVIDRHEIEEADTLLARGMQSYVAEDISAMERSFDLLLAKYPNFAERDKLAPGYAALGLRRFEAGQLASSLDAYRRALRLAPKNPDEVQWRAQLEFVSAELALTQGVVDLAGYERALAIEADHAGARAAYERLSGEHGKRVRENKRFAALCALGLLLAAVMVGLLGRTSAAKSQVTASDTLA
jgi:tetratricopeptide (TPR) repeat protein